MHPKMIPVLSSNIEGYAYLEPDKQLIITFKNGGSYAYGDVPKDVVAAFSQVKSKGEFFQRSIREKFPTEKLSADELNALMSAEPMPAPKPRPRKRTITLQSLMKQYPSLAAYF